MQRSLLLLLLVFGQWNYCAAHIDDAVLKSDVLIMGTVISDKSADAWFDSLFRQSTLIVGGRVLHQDVSKSDDANHEWTCTLDLIVVHVGAGGRLSVDSLLHYYPGDTLRGLTYFAASQTDTLARSDYFVVPVQADSLNRKNISLTCTDSRNGIFVEDYYLYAHCMVFLHVIEPGIVHTVYLNEKDGWRSFSSYDKLRNRVSFHAQKQRSTHVTLMRTRKYDEEGKITERRRYRTIYHPVRYKTIIWKFREGGRICLKRRVLITARF